LKGFSEEDVKQNHKTHQLRPYQIEDVQKILRKLKLFSGALIMNQQRTGKTPTTISAIYSLGTKKNIYLTPNAVAYQFNQEIQDWTQNDATVLTGTKTQRKNIISTLSELDEWNLVIPHHLVATDLEELQKLDLDTLLIDEAHILRNWKSKQSKAIFSLSRKAKYRIALTGTPAIN
jgi:superfamily II DNA or RNA helicase